MARYDDLDIKFITFATIISCLLLVVILQATQALCYYMTDVAQAEKLDKSEYVSSKAIIKDQVESLNRYEKVPVPPVTGPDGKPVESGPASRLQIPLDRAMDLILQEAKSAKPKETAGT
jgi:hypothetical protein